MFAVPQPPALRIVQNKSLSMPGKCALSRGSAEAHETVRLNDFPAPDRLNANYTPYADGNVPRQGLYSSYRRICDHHGIPHMNTATLGKAIRLCFPAIKTRRLGVRGNSKYHCKLSMAMPEIRISLANLIGYRLRHTAIQHHRGGMVTGLYSKDQYSWPKWR